MSGKEHITAITMSDKPEEPAAAGGRSKTLPGKMSQAERKDAKEKRDAILAAQKAGTELAKAEQAKQAKEAAEAAAVAAAKRESEERIQAEAEKIIAFNAVLKLAIAWAIETDTHHFTRFMAGGGNPVDKNRPEQIQFAREALVRAYQSR